jgi:urease accessory protein
MPTPAKDLDPDARRSLPRTTPGQGMLEVAHVAKASAVVGLSARAPLHLLTPRPRGLSIWAYAATFGGGLVAGDTIDLNIRVGPDARALLSTQASTKVYRSEGLPARQKINAEVAEGALLAVLPDPICCFAGAIYEQQQRFDLAPRGSLLLVDWLSAGRSARRERWVLSSYRSLTEIRVGGRLLVRDALHLEGGPSGSIAERLGRFDAIAFAALIGPALADSIATLLEQIGGRPVHPIGAAPPRPGSRAGIVASASPIAGGAVLRVAGESVAAVGDFLRHTLASIPPLLGDDPWARKA